MKRETAAEAIERLSKQLATANARISDLEAACVMGGDGKPIGIGSNVYFYSISDGRVLNKPVKQIKETDCGILLSDGGGVHGAWSRYSKTCYSSPDQVP